MDRLYVEETAGRPPAVVLLHHGAGSLRAWDAFLPAFAGRRRLLAYDRRGFGSSPHNAVFDPGLFDRDAEDLAGLLRDHGAAPAHLVGHSDGATVALVTAYSHSGLVLSVTAIAGHVRLDPATREARRSPGTTPARISRTGPSGRASSASWGAISCGRSRTRCRAGRASRPRPRRRRPSPPGGNASWP
jgi:pimeloyl-ACP methyl ester carboxylesterase